MKLEVLETPLGKTNLIEASAGTGKTYSIAVLVLRLLLEREMPIEKILLVTFTEDAARELKSRCARFIRLGLMELEEPCTVEDPNIRAIVKKGSRELYQQLLRRALFDLDKAKISTIHSFCQQTLTAYAFETGQSFGMELWSNIDALIDHELSDYFRNEMAIKDPALIRKCKLDQFDWFKSAVVQALNGKELMPIGANHQQLEHELATAMARVVPRVKERVERKNILTFDDMIRALHHKREDERLQKFLRAQYDAVFVDEFQDTDVLQYEIFYHFFQQDGGKVIFYIGDPKQSIYSFRNADLDVYQSAKEAIEKSGGRLWHMNVNFRSSEELLDRCNAFFRSSARFHPFSYDVAGGHAIEYRDVEPKQQEKKTGIQDNDGPVKPFAIREYDEDVDKELTARIRYLLSGSVLLNGKPIRPRDIAVIMRTNKECQKLKNVLSRSAIPAVVIDETSIFQTQEATSFLYLLRALLETTESNIHAFLMEPLLKFSVEDLKKVNFDELVLLFKKWRNRWETHGLPAVVENVRQVLDIQSKWEDNVTQGHRILSNLQQLTDILQARTANHRLTPEDVYRFLKTQMKSGGKDLSDLEQATEYSVRIESDEEAVQIMTIHKSKGLEFPIVLLAELELKNKPISSHVYFSFKYSEGKYYFVKYHNKDDQTPNYKEFEGKYQSQLEEENKRLIYVGVTRAKYHVCLMVKKRKAAKNGYRIDSVGTIHQYLDALVEKNMMQDFMEREIPDLQELNLAPSSPSERTPLPNYPKPNFPDKNYHKLSYSFISGSHSSVSVPSERTYDEQSYEHFVFKALPRGLQVGHLLHHIFEFIDFTSSDQYDDMIQRALMRHMPGKQADEQFACNLKQLVDQVLGVRLNNGIPLRDVKREQRINEFEFHFPVPSDLKLLSLEYFFGNGEKTISTCKAEVKGMMNGFVDMVFEYDGKYYILDWKSNFLGDTYDDYSEDKLLQAMNASNYHLQYMIYTVALDRFLQLRLTDYCYDQHFGGVFYLFLRGIHAEKPGNGVYFTRPEPKEVRRLSTWFEGTDPLFEKKQEVV